MRRSMAMPRAVPSWAAVLMMPAAVARSLSATLVPRVVAATDESPIPPPSARMVIGTVHTLAAEEMSAASQIAIAPRPVAITRCGGQRARLGAARAEPMMTARLNGSSTAAAVSGPSPRVF
jgi:hypothetical protein